MPWRRKPANFLRYWSGPVDRAAVGASGRQFKTVLIYCVALTPGPDGRPHSCNHVGRLRLADLPDWDWYDISAHLKCTACGKVGWVDTRLDWGEVINFAKGVLG